jgi:TPR repeat protein
VNARGRVALTALAAGFLLIGAPGWAKRVEPEAAGHYRRAQAAERAEGPKADAQAIAHYLKAAGLGHPRAQVALAGHYLSGKGVTRSVDEAIRWYGRAAEQGDGEAFYKLGALYQRGGAEVKAYACYRLAVALANGDARRRATGGLARLAPRLTAAERLQAEELATGWRSTIDR